MKILLITCAEPGERFVDGTGHARQAQLTLPVVAAATPPGHDITLYDEKIESLEDLPDADIAGITLHTTVAPHAYATAQRLRERGMFVVLGGPHPTCMPQEAIQYADSVIVGDAEDTWPRLLRDFEKGRTERLYQSTFPDLDNIKPPRMDLLNQKAYPTLALTQATRGCPMRCDFCSVPSMGGQRFRKRPIQNVVDEVAQLKGRLVVFWDDNVTSDRDYAMALFEALIPLKRKWVSMVTTSFALDREMIALARKSGLIGVFVGIETFSRENLRSARKSFNKVDKYRQMVKNLHDYDIHVGAGIIFGFDHDDTSVFSSTLELLADLRIDSANLNLLVPFPGSPIFDRYRQEGRLLTMDWTQYHPNKHVAYQPAKMTPKELMDGLSWATDEYFSPLPILKRFWHSPFGTKHFTWFINWHYWSVKRTYDWEESHAAALPEMIQPPVDEQLRIVG